MRVAFGIVMITAAWKHLNALEQVAAMPTVCDLRAYSEVLIWSLRYGPTVGLRRFFPVSELETICLARQQGLKNAFCSGKCLELLLGDWASLVDVIVDAVVEDYFLFSGFAGTPNPQTSDEANAKGINLSASSFSEK